MTEDALEPHKEQLHARMALLRAAFLVEGGMLVAALALGALLGIRFWENARFTAPDAIIGVAAGMAMLAAAVTITETSLPFAVRMRRDMKRLTALFRGATLAELLLISILAGLGEEALFRGFFQPWLAGYIGLPAALAVASAVFGLVHCISRAYVFFAGALGLLFGLLYIWSGNIAVPMIAHAAYDFVALAFALRALSRETGV